MKTLLRVYAASCLIVAGFFTFFLIPWGLLPFSDAVDLMVVGGALTLGALIIPVYWSRHEGFEFGWFLVHRGGFWVIVACVIGVLALVCGSLLLIAPELFVPAFEQGSLPFGIAIVSLFWLALIYMFGYLTVGMAARVTAHARRLEISDMVVNSLVALVCLGLATLFFSLFLEVINDIAVRISVPTRWTAIWIFVGALIAAGIIYGAWEDPSTLIKDDETEVES